MPLCFKWPLGVLLIIASGPLWAGKKVDLDYHVQLMPQSNQAQHDLLAEKQPSLEFVTPPLTWAKCCGPTASNVKPKKSGALFLKKILTALQIGRASCRERV